jgi:pimeloyl-ACP methyl ester carboxylesterase
MPTVLFIHGMFMNSRSWENWLPYFESKGYSTLAPDWPYHEGDPKWLRKNIPPELGKLGLTDLVDHFAEIIKSLPEKPIIVGHSMGGIVAQLLVARGLAASAVCMSTAPPKGVISFKWSFLKGNFPTVNPFKGNSPCIMTLPRFHYTFCNTMTMEETAQAFDRYVVPETRNAARQGTTNAGKVDFQKPHIPMLFIAGAEDTIVPCSLVERNAKKYPKSSGITDFKSFDGRSHYIFNQDNWEEVADYILHWLPSPSATNT